MIILNEWFLVEEKIIIVGCYIISIGLYLLEDFNRLKVIMFCIK